MNSDVLVIGAGILGLSSAYHIKKTNPNLKVRVVDQLSGPAQGNTAKCAGGYRNMLTTEINKKLFTKNHRWRRRETKAPDTGQEPGRTRASENGSPGDHHHQQSPGLFTRYWQTWVRIRNIQ